jgi:RNA polymerase sigma-70 factor (ECF subfamily)
MVTAALAPQNERSYPPAGGVGKDRLAPDLELAPALADAALGAAVAAGDIAAFDTLYRRYRPAAFATAFALLREPDAAEDAVHDALLRAWRSAASFQPARGSLRSWLLTIVRHTAIDHLRARQLARRPQPKLAYEATADDGDDIFTSVAIAADARRLREALRALPAEQRHALELAFFAGLTHGEIAARTGTPLGTVKGRVRLGLRRLRRDLSDLALDPGPHASRHLPASAT